MTREAITRGLSSKQAADVIHNMTDEMLVSLLLDAQ